MNFFLLLFHSAPFNIGIGFFFLTFIFILWKWSENYGRKKVFPHTTFISAIKALRSGC
jgi:hypothetical protein